MNTKAGNYGKLLRKSAIVLGLSVLMPSFSTQPAAATADLPKPLIPITQDFTLPNGLRVILAEDHSAPVASVVLVYDVGARNEAKGRSGFAHLFEHMMFEGSENVGKTEHFKLIQGAGGSCNASTHSDFTNYFDRVPSNQVNLALWLEADRLRSLKVTPENFKNQLETVKEEKRLRIDNQPYAPASLKVDELTFDNWSNAHPVIGSFEDLEASSINDVRSFFKSYYAPNNAVLAVVGDIDAGAVHKSVEKYFGNISRAQIPAKPDLTEPEQTKPKYAQVVDAHAQLPAFWMSFKTPPTRSADYFPLRIAENILAAGESSRLYQRMVKGDQIALRADAGLDARRGPSAFSAFVLFKPNTTTKQAQQVVWNEIDKLKQEPVTPSELDKAKNQILRNYFSSNSHDSLQKTLGRAETLAEYALFYGDPKLIDQDMAALMNVKAEDIQRVAKKYLKENAVTVVDVVPAEHKAQEPGQNTTIR